MSMGAIGIDLDRRFEPLQSAGVIAPLGLGFSQADQGLHVVGITLERRVEARRGLVDPPLEQEDAT